MSEPKGPFDDAIRILHEAKGEAILVDEELVEVQLDAAIRVLEDWPKWESLIEAANPIVEEISNFADNDLTEYQVIRFKDLVRLRKAIADYEGD